MFDRTGGVQQVVQHLHDGLTKKGHIVKIITPKPPGFKNEAPDDYIILGSTTNFTAGFGAAGNWGLPTDSKEMAQILKKEKFDVINFHEPWAPLLAWQMIRQTKAAFVGTFHANLFDRPSTSSWVNVFTPYARNLGKRLHVITAVSPAPAALMIQKAQTSFEKRMVADIKYIPNGVDLNIYKPFKKRLPLNGPDTKTVLYVGRLDRRKNVEALIRAFALVEAKMPKAYLNIAGEGSRRGSLDQLAKTLGIKNIHFSGYVNEDEKRRLMGNADVFCSPAIVGESFGIVLIEAMAMGCPVVAGRNSGYIHVLTNTGRVGLVDPKATEDFAERLMVIISDGKLSSTLRAWGLAEVKKFDYTKIIDQYEKTYMEAYIKWRIEQHLNGVNSKNAKKFWKTKRRFPLRRFFR
ncbi:hypothetical protein A3F65_03765 [Candidatus Saccharibacteria bacterium RIFCSPHIGHO2_12_FULL_47_16b]|nr:MAG: hypothetical protein A3F65_03765 [Candidatus Saccharibacteria bacterium RIFCSPHIGHO2_12_FULL_47_16b]OGL39524.1 MAG: hypothetical protein A3J32_00450 [Candidatus Saccharibacteria bacterium RIFCSPLOWO2_02_FULL_46_7]